MEYFFLALMFPMFLGILFAFGALIYVAARNIIENNGDALISFIILSFCIGVVGLILSTITTIIFIGPVLYIGLVVWYILRVALGFRYLLNDSAHPNYMTYWIK